MRATRVPCSSRISCGRWRFLRLCLAFMAHGLSHSASPTPAKTATAAVLPLGPCGRIPSGAFTCGSSIPGRGSTRGTCKKLPPSQIFASRELSKARLICVVIGHIGSIGSCVASLRSGHIGIYAPCLRIRRVTAIVRPVRGCSSCSSGIIILIAHILFLILRSWRAARLDLSHGSFIYREALNV